jgi:Xaa-Pro aminopeptidase
VITALPNIRYLSGFSGGNAVLVLGRDGDVVFGTDGRYRDQAAAECPDLVPVLDRDTLAATVAAAGRGTLAVESGLGVGAAHRLRSERGDIEVGEGLVEELRGIKDEGELAALGRASAITASAIGVLASEIRIGMSERAVARRLEQLFGELGAEDRAFDTIVGSGPHSAIPHHQPGSRQLQAGDLLVVDAGARVEGYHADMTRTFIVGGQVEAWQSEVHAVVLAAQQAAAAGCRPGASARERYGVARAVIDDAGYGPAFTHGLGHGVGLEIHEAPMLGPRSAGSLARDMAITVEPGVYLTGRGGVRIEDTLVVSDTGPGILTEAPRDLVPVG